MEQEEVKKVVKKKAEQKVYKATDIVKCEINSPFRKKVVTELKGDVFNVLQSKGYAKEL